MSSFASCLLLTAAVASLLLAPAARLRAADPLAGLEPDPEFQVLGEADLPAGFPKPTPVGTIELKELPVYRKAETPGAGGFWTLFQHIKTNKIEMTAPVEMTYAGDGAPTGPEAAMAFLYGEPTWGTPGEAGKVTVSDVPAATVLSLGFRGPRTKEVQAEAHRRLLAWLEEHAAEYAPAGPVRVMGYNSPFVPKKLQFFEMQIPVSKRED